MRTAGLFTLLTVLSAGAAAAQPVPVGAEGPLADLVAPVHGRRACFARAYDAAHLARHQRQRVTAMTLALRYHRHPADRQNPQGQRNYDFTLSAALRGGTGLLSASGECTAREGRIACELSCDGGGFGLRRMPDGHVHVDLTAYGRLRLTRGCDGDDANGVELKPGAADQTFRLAPRPAGACRF